MFDWVVNAPLHKLEENTTSADHIPSNFLKAVFHNVYLVHS